MYTRCILLWTLQGGEAYSNPNTHAKTCTYHHLPVLNHIQCTLCWSHWFWRHEIQMSSNNRNINPQTGKHPENSTMTGMIPNDWCLANHMVDVNGVNGCEWLVPCSSISTIAYIESRQYCSSATRLSPEFDRVRESQWHPRESLSGYSTLINPWKFWDRL